MPSQGASQIKQRVAANVRVARAELGMTQMEFATRLGTRPGDVSRWETGFTLPRLKALTAMAELTARDVSWFYTDHTAEPEPQAAA